MFFCVLLCGAPITFSLLTPQRTKPAVSNRTLEAEAADRGTLNRTYCHTLEHGCERPTTYFDKLGQFLGIASMTPSHRLLEPVLTVPAGLNISINGWAGDRIRANELNWLIPAPATNPGMAGMFTHRLEWPLPDNPVAWAGEFAGKYLISAVQSLSLTANAELELIVRQFVS
jgi:hypothetical protein